MTKAVIVFFISLAVYLVIIVGIGVYKYIRNKRKIKKDIENNPDIVEGGVVDEQNQNKINLATLKYNAVKLRANYQIPLRLYLLISALTDKSTEKQVKFLINKSEQLMRVRGFYKKYHDQDISVSKQLLVEYQNI